jgi:hypothetical protein
VLFKGELLELPMPFADVRVTFAAELEFFQKVCKPEVRQLGIVDALTALAFIERHVGSSVNL